jgi:putative mycofactocin binding protein MftB
VKAEGALGFDPDAALRLGAHVVLRHERFGAIVYDLRTRCLMVVRDLDLVAVLDRLGVDATAGDAVAAVAPARSRALYAALARLAQQGLLSVG